MHIQVPILCHLLVSNGKCISHALQVLLSCYHELLKPTKPTNVATSVYSSVFPLILDSIYLALRGLGLSSSVFYCNTVDNVNMKGRREELEAAVFGNDTMELIYSTDEVRK